MPRSAHPAVARQLDLWTGPELFPLPPRERARQAASPEQSNGHVLLTFRPQLGSISRLTARARAVAQRRLRVALLVEEEGLERGAMTRIAGWLGVSPSTIGRDVKALLTAGDPIVVAALAHAHRRRTNGMPAHTH